MYACYSVIEQKYYRVPIFTQTLFKTKSYKIIYPFNFKRRAVVIHSAANIEIYNIY